jgi:hypothetical protein
MTWLSNPPGVLEALGVLLYSFDQDVRSVSRKSPQVLAIAAQNRSARLGRSNDHGVDG